MAGEAILQEKDLLTLGEFDTAEGTYTEGASTDTWGHTWSVEEVTSTFRVKVVGHCSNNGSPSTSRTRCKSRSITLFPKPVIGFQPMPVTGMIPPIGLTQAGDQRGRWFRAIQIMVFFDGAGGSRWQCHGQCGCRDSPV